MKEEKEMHKMQSEFHGWLTEHFSKVTDQSRTRVKEDYSYPVYSEHYKLDIWKLQQMAGIMDVTDEYMQLGQLKRRYSDKSWIDVMATMARMVLLKKNDTGDMLSYLVSHPHQPMVFSPGVIKDLKMAYKLKNFNPDIMEPVDIYPRGIHGQTFAAPAVHISATVVKTLAHLSLRNKNRIPYMLGYAFDKTTGLREAHETAHSEEGYIDSLLKMNNNKGKLTDPGILNWLLWGTDEVGLLYHMDTVVLHTPELTLPIIEEILNKDASAGFQPDDVISVSSTGERVSVKNKKKDTWRATAEMITRRVLANRLYQNSGEKTDEYFNTTAAMMEDMRTVIASGSVVSILVESRKYEIIRQGLWDTINEDGNVDVYKKAMLKTRLFYISSSYEFVLDSILYDVMCKRLRGNMSAIGLRGGRGGFQIIWDILTKGGPLEEQWEEVYAWAKKFYPDINLRKRQYAEGDWSGYDQSLIAQQLAITIALVRVLLNDKNSQTLSTATIVQLVVDFIKSNVHKTVYVYATDQHYDVWGTMFSGKKSTSTEDTLYQMVLKVVYMEKLRMLNEDNEIIQKIIMANMCIFFFYGDDQIVGYPEYINGFLMYPQANGLLEDFIIFCTEKMGMRHKESSFKKFDEAYGARSYTTLDDSTIIETGRKESLSFLKTRVCHIWLDGTYQGIYPYRTTIDLISKMGVTISATKDAKLAMCLYASLASLSVGNLEAYSILRSMYDTMTVLNGRPTEEDFQRLLSVKGSRSLSAAIAEGDAHYNFPSLVTLQMNQSAGIATGDGFPARDLDGNEVPLWTVYTAEKYISGFDEESELTDVFYDDDFDFEEDEDIEF